MQHTVLVLEDTDFWQEKVKNIIRYRDAHAEFQFAYTVEDAQAIFNVHEDICYLVVDLLMMRDYEPQGTKFIVDLLQQARTAHLPILAVSCERPLVEDLTKILKGYPQHQVTIVLRTWDYEQFKAKVNEFIRRIKGLCSAAG